MPSRTLAGDPTKAGLLTGVLAVLVVLAYPKVKPRAKWLIDRLFFRDWVEREADLARFERQQGSTGGAAQTAAPSVVDADEPRAVALRRALRGVLQSVGVEWQALRWEALQRERVRA